MKNMRTTITLCMLAACLSPLISGASEETPAARPEASASATFNLKFPGGTIKSLLDLIERQSGQKPNVVCATDVADTPLPALDLRSVRTESVLEVLRVVVGDREPLVCSRMGNIYALERRSIPTANRVYYVGNLLKKFKVQDITTAIQTAWEMGGSAVKPQLKYHEETQLLIVLADGQQQATIKNVLEELRPALEPAAGEPGAATAKPASAPSAR
jgi:hypothetical protein